MSKNTKKAPAKKAPAKSGRKAVWTKPSAVISYNKTADKTVAGLRAAIVAARGCTPGEADAIIAETACNRLSALLKYAMDS